MVEEMAAKDILESYDQISVLEYDSLGESICFELYDKKFVMICPSDNVLMSSTNIFLYDNSDFEYPHVMWNTMKVEDNEIVPAGEYRHICLYENDSVIFSLMSYEEKIIDALERLISLMGFSKDRIEKELQKEFLYYWNDDAKPGLVDLYLEHTNLFARINVYLNKDNERVRIVTPGVNLHDIRHKSTNEEKIWVYKNNISAIFIPICDARGILPPYPSNKWNKDNIIEILYGKQIKHIDEKTYTKIITEKIKTQQLFIVFEINNGNTEVDFVVKVTFKDKSSKTILDKISKDVIDVQTVQSNRNDYLWLNKKIGNEITEATKSTLLIGAGSMGSYAAEELIKNGHKQLTIYDGDLLSSENTMRWVYSPWAFRYKAELLKDLLELQHPEMQITAVNKMFTPSYIAEELEKTEMVIISVGSSDVMLSLNSAFAEAGCCVPVIYVWLEAGGKYSHILVIDYRHKGCVECMFTDSQGQMINNKVNIVTDEDVEKMTLRDGCGGTRVAYGTSVLLRTTSVLLDVINTIRNNGIDKNCLINISPERITFCDDNSFAEKECRCCGSKNFK